MHVCVRHLTPYHHHNHQTVFLRDAFAGEEKVVLKPEDCKTNFPICDTSLESYPDAPICPPTSFKARTVPALTRA